MEHLKVEMFDVAVSYLILSKSTVWGRGRGLRSPERFLNLSPEIKFNSILCFRPEITLRERLGTFNTLPCIDWAHVQGCNSIVSVQTRTSPTRGIESPWCMASTIEPPVTTPWARAEKVLDTSSPRGGRPPPDTSQPLIPHGCHMRARPPPATLRPQLELSRPSYAPSPRPRRHTDAA